MNGVIKAIWAFCRIFSTALTSIGLGGLIFFAGVGFSRLFNRLIGEGDGREA